MCKEQQALLEEDLQPVSDPSAPCNFASLLAAAVVLDSYFFKPELKDKKWTDEDTQAHEWLSQFADVGHNYWQVLNDAKFDVNLSMQLGLQGILGRDYKNYQLSHFEESKDSDGPAQGDSGSTSGKGGVMGVAVSVGSIATLQQHFSAAEIAENLRLTCEKRSLGLLVVIGL